MHIVTPTPPCQWVGQSVSGSVIGSFGHCYCIYQACELVKYEWSPAFLNSIILIKYHVSSDCMYTYIECNRCGAMCAQFSEPSTLVGHPTSISNRHCATHVPPRLSIKKSSGKGEEETNCCKVLLN